MSTNKYTIKLYWEQMKKYKTSFFLALFSIPIAALFISTLLPYFFSQAIGGLSSKDESSVILNLALATIIGIVGTALNLVGFQMLTRHEGSVRASLSDATFKQVIEKAVRFFVNE